MLWKRFTRAVRRREEGQALVLIAMASVAMVAVVGLSVDGGMAYWEAQKLQRAADSAALAGVVWIPNQPGVADARGRLTVQSAGYNAFYQSGNQQASFTNAQVNGGEPGQYTSYVGNAPNSYQYHVVLGTKARRFFMGVLGFGDLYVQRESTAEYATPARLGGSFNYFGSSSLKFDWLIRDKASQNDEYYTTLWNRYIKNRCDQITRPDPCVGTFWLNTQGPETNHSSGDAYDPISDGATAINTTNTPYSGSVNVAAGTGYQAGAGCVRTNDYASWANTQSWWYGLGAGCDTTSNNPNVTNKDLHPDGDNARGFGYSIAVQVDGNALHPYTGSPANPYTSLRVSIYDASESDAGAQEQFGPSDNYWGTTATYGARPYGGITGANTAANRKKLASDATRGDDAKISCNTGGLPAVASDGQSRRENGSIITGGTVTTANQYCQNGMRTRFSLYYPPLADGTPTLWRTKGSLVAAFDATELTAQNEIWEWNYPGTTGSTTSSRCYFADTNYPNTTPQSPDTILVFACPSGQGPSNVGTDDIYWNNDVSWPVPTPLPVGITTAYDYYESAAFKLAHPGNAAGVDSTTLVDPSQGCRPITDPALYDATATTSAPGTGYTNAMNLGVSVEPPYRNKRVPYNMRGYDPLVGRTWDFSSRYNPGGTYNPVGGYQSYHGWRCSWDFDSSATLNPGSGGDTTHGGADINKDRRDAEGISYQPYLFISDYGYINGGSTKQRIKYQDGVRSLPTTAQDLPNVRNGVYLLQAQVFGGGATNRYAVKAEYDNPKAIQATFTDALGNKYTKQINPVPQVYGITAMNIYVNADNQTGSSLNVIFDLAYIPVQNAGALATLELWDAGDVSINTLEIQILEPTGYGQKLNAGVVPIGAPIKTTSLACPSQYGGSTAVPCTNLSGLASTSTIVRSNGTTYFNDQWLYMLFSVPDSTKYKNWGDTCNLQEVPEYLCYYYQVNYKLTGTGGASDTTTWQLSIKNQPVHLVE